MESAKAGGPEPSRALARKIEKLTELLTEIQLGAESAPAQLLKFQSLYWELTQEEKPWFFDGIIRKVEIQKTNIDGQLRNVLDADSADPLDWSRLMTDLRRKMESPRMRAFRRFLNVSGGFKFLLDLRADILVAQRQTTLDLDPLDEEISHLFDTWFHHGFLFLSEITAESSFRQIRFLKDHDMVHPMASLEEMGSRLGQDRRCFALYHRAMPEEPVIFIEAALTHGIARSIHDIIPERPEATASPRPPDTAVFYSINNTQNGLAGLGLGKILIFQVVDAIKKDQSAIRTFSSLSPIPGFWRRYLKPLLEGRAGTFVLDRNRIEQFFSERAARSLIEHHAANTRGNSKNLAASVLEILSDPGWIQDPTLVKWMKKPLTELTYFYITREKNRQDKPLNPVANFHMSNGATVAFNNINFGANRSERGLRDSCGMMVNYLYPGNWLQEIRRTMRSWLSWNR